jgi:hypothetical protein
MIPLGKQQLQNHLAVFFQLLRVGLYHHPILGFRGTCRHQPSRAFHLYQAEPAGADRRQTFQMTQRREFNPILATRLEQGCTNGSATLFTIYRQSDN